MFSNEIHVATHSVYKTRIGAHIDVGDGIRTHSATISPTQNSRPECDVYSYKWSGFMSEGMNMEQLQLKLLSYTIIS